MTNESNRLPGECVNDTSVNMFKKVYILELDVGYEYNRTLNKLNLLPCPVPSWVPNIIRT